MRRIVTAVLVLAVFLTISGSMLAGAPPDPATQQASDPLVKLLEAKGVLSAEEAQEVAAVPATQQRDHLTALLLKKGVISQNDLQGVSTSNERLVGFSSSSSSMPVFKPAVLVGQAPAPAQAAAPKAPPAPAVIPAVAPIRVAAIDPPKREGLVPAFKLGPVSVRPYGFVKMSLVHDSSSPLGNDFLLPGFIGDTGPNGAPEFRIKARGTRLGSNFEWLDPSKTVTVTGKIEFDFEGNYTSVANRGISSLRSSQASIRLAFGRIDYAISPNDTLYGVFGQDWTPFGSSTLPNTLETTGLGIGYGSLYERGQMIKGGLVHNFGGSRTFKWLTEFAIVNPSSGNQPFPFPASSNFQIPGTNPTSALAPVSTFPVTGCATPPCGTVAVGQTPNNGLGVGTQLAIGERQGPDSDRPELEARVAFQFQLDKAKGVAPAQIILSGVQGRRESVVLAANVPALNLAAAIAAGLCPPTQTVSCPFYSNAFGTTAPAGSRGVRTGSERWGLNPQIQLPTRWFTLLGSYYRGADLRWFFAGQILSFYNDTAGLGNTISVPNVDGSSLVVLGTTGTAATAFTPVVAPQRPVRTSGGFVEVGLPLSRWANANPTGRNAGWSMNLHYGLDDVNNRDLRKVSAGSIRDRSDWAFVNLMYKLNSFVTFGYEQSYYRTKAFRSSAAACTATPTIATCFPNTLYRGLPARSWHDLRSEFATIFTF